MNTLESTQSHSPASFALPVHDLTDAQWERIVPLLPELNQGVVRRGRPCVNLRGVVNAGARLACYRTSRSNCFIPTRSWPVTFLVSANRTRARLLEPKAPTFYAASMMVMLVVPTACAFDLAPSPLADLNI
jgi:hypothetical protein